MLSRTIRVLVLSRMPPAQRNAVPAFFTFDREKVRFALEHYKRRMDDGSTVINQLLEKYKGSYDVSACPSADPKIRTIHRAIQTHGFRVMAAKKTATMPGMTDFLYTGVTIGYRERLSLFHPKFKEHTATSYEPI